MKSSTPTFSNRVVTPRAEDFFNCTSNTSRYRGSVSYSMHSHGSVVPSSHTDYASEHGDGKQVVISRSNSSTNLDDDDCTDLRCHFFAFARVPTVRKSLP